MHASEQQTNDFIEVIRAYDRLIHKVCHLYLNNEEGHQDLYQEIILQIWTAFPKFKNEAKISTWLYRIALNTAISYNRKNKKSIQPLPLDTSFIQLADSNHDNHDYQLMWQLISKLPHLEKALVLLYLEDNSYEEIAAIMGISITNVGTKLGRIKEKLKKQAQVLHNQ